MKSKKGQKRIFWEAFVLALFVFGIGVALGFFIEGWRGGEIDMMYLNSEVELLDLKLQGQILDLNLVDCDKAIAENIRFADRVYEEAKTLKSYEDAQRLSESLILQHKKYDLLRALVWMNSIKIKEKCNANYHNIVYIYQYDNPGIEKRSEQSIFSKLLEELKNRQGDKALLLPIAGDLSSISIDTLRYKYNITELPTILIDEKIKITELNNVEEIEKLLK